MFKIASRTLVMALGAACFLALAEPAPAQSSRASKAKSSRVTSKQATRSAPSAVRSRPSVNRGVTTRARVTGPTSRPTITSKPRVNVTPQRQGVQTQRSSVRSRSQVGNVKPRVNVSGQERDAKARPRVNVTPQRQGIGDGVRSRAGIGSVKPRVNVSTQERDARAKPRINVAPDRGRSDISSAKAGQRTSSRAELDARARTDGRGAASSFRNGSDIGRAKADVIRSGGARTPESSFRDRADGRIFNRDYVSRFRERPSARAWASARSRFDRLHRRYERRHPGYTYWNGFWDGYSFGYHRGYHVGFHSPFHFHHHDLHHHYYGTHLVLGYHFGGFGFYHNNWHFAIVVGAPLVTYHTGWYGYSWWDGYGRSLVTWDRAMETYGGSYAFADGSCVELHFATTDGTTYEIKIDPRYYDADDPGELYAELWSELSTQGELRIQDINGAIHIFPAGMIQQIEARGCR